MSSPSLALSEPTGPTRSTPAACTQACTGPTSRAAASAAAASARSTLTEVNVAPPSEGGATSRPVTCHPSASRRSAMALPMPELVPVTRARRSLGTDVGIGDDLLRQRHVVGLELDEVVDAS